MSKVRANNFTNKAGDGAPTFPYGANVTGIVTATSAIVGSGITINSSGINATGVITATSYQGDGSALTGIDATSLKDSGGNIKVQANPNGAVVTGVLTATSFEGDGSALTGIDATAITNGTSNVTVSENANINVVRSGTTRLSINEAGIDVTGEATVDGIHIGGGKIRGDSSNHVFIQGGNVCNVYVSDSGNDSTGTGESNSPVRTINRAVELLPKVMGNQTFNIRIQGSSYTTSTNEAIRGFSFNGSNDISRFIEIGGDTQTITFNLRHGFDFYNVHGLRLTGINFVVESGYSGYMRFISCSEGRIYNSCSFTTSSTAGWSERIGFYNCRNFRWDANITASSSASSGLGGLVVLSNYSQVDMYCTVSKSGTRFGNHGIVAANGAELRGSVSVDNFNTGISFGQNHYNAETGGRGMLNGSTISNCSQGIQLYNYSYVRKYSVTYSSNGNNEYIVPGTGGATH